MNASQAQELNSRWLLRIVDLKNNVKVEATIRFTAETATESCMGGNWKRVFVETKSAHDEKFFPLAQPIAYTIQRGELIVGRTSICDGYLFLSGKPKKSSISGSYNAVSSGTSNQLGYFSIKKIR